MYICITCVAQNIMAMMTCIVLSYIHNYIYEIIYTLYYMYIYRLRSLIDLTIDFTT